MICSDNFLIPVSIQFYIPLILSIISFICSLFTLLTLVLYPRLRINSGKLIFFIVISEINTNWLTILSLFYSTENNCIEYEMIKILKLDLYDCDIIGAIFIFFTWFYLLLNFSLSHNLYYSLNFLADNFSKRFKIYLAFCLFSSLAILISTLSISQGISNSFMGICGMSREKSVQVVSGFFLLIIFPFSIYVVVIVLRKLQEKKRNSSPLNFDEKNEIFFLRMNMFYILLFLIDWLPISILQFWNWWCRFYIQCETENLFEKILEILALLLLSGNGFFLFLIRVQEPSLKKIFLLPFQRKKHFADQMNSHLLEANLKSSPQNSRINQALSLESLGKRVSLENSFESKEEENTVERNVDILQILYLLNKIYEIPSGPNSLLKSIGLPFLGSKPSFEDDLGKTEDNAPWANHYYTKFEVELFDCEQILNNINEEGMTENKIVKKIFGNEAKQTVTGVTYCELLFNYFKKKIFKVDNFSLSLSLDFFKNSQRLIEKNEVILKEFVTHDFKVIVLIISKKVKKFLLDDFLKNYHVFVKENRLTFLHKILGFHSWQFSESAKSYSVLLLENPFSELKFYNMKNNDKTNMSEILAIFMVAVEETKKTNVIIF